MTELYAENVNYWKSSRSAPDTWLDRAKKEVERAGGELLGDGFVNDALAGTAAYMLAFRVGDDSYKMLWPVLHSKSGNQKAARTQAATALYHEVKASCVKAKFLGIRTAFFAYLLTAGGLTLPQLDESEVQDFPRLLSSTEVYADD